MSNPPRYADLHVHTNFSDGSDSPGRVMARAHALGLAAIAITDHDTMAGLEEAAAAAKKLGIEFMPGVEISTTYGQTEVHVVGLGIDAAHPGLNHALESLRVSRQTRLDKILERLHALKVNLSRKEVEAQAEKASAIGRVHIARALLDRGEVKTIQEAFDRYIGRGKKAFVPKHTISCHKAIQLIHAAGGLAFLGHPGVGATIKKILPHVLTLPFDGIEVYHIQHSPGEATQFLQVAEERGLLVSGGSDCHGDPGGIPDMGKVRLPYRNYESIRKALSDGTRR